MSKWSRFYKYSFCYWNNPIRNSRGDLVFSTPIEIKGYYVMANERFVASNGEEITSKAVIRTDKLIPSGGYIFLGKLVDLNIKGITDPRNSSDTFVIRSVMSSHALSDGAVEYKVML